MNLGEGNETFIHLVRHDQKRCWQTLISVVTADRSRWNKRHVLCSFVSEMQMRGFKGPLAPRVTRAFTSLAK
jgi:hypothetical protein